MVTYEPVAGELLRGGGYKIFDSANIPNRISDVLVVRRDVTTQYKQTLQSLVSGYFAARQLMTDDRQGALSKMAFRSGITEEHLSEAYKGLHLPSLEENRIWLGLCEKYVGKRIRELAQLMKTHELIDVMPTNHMVCDATWVQGVSL